MRPIPILPAALVAGFAVAQQRLPVPDTAQLAAVGAEVATIVGAAGQAGAVDRLVDRARSERGPALRFALLRQAVAQAERDGDVAGGLRAADALDDAFEVPPQRGFVLAGLEQNGCAAPQALAHAHLEEALRAAGADDRRFGTALANAERVAAVDDPPGLRAAVFARCATIRRLVAPTLEGGFAMSLVETHPRLLIGGLALVEPTFTVDDDLATLARLGERELAACARWTDPLLRILARRRALSLLKPLASTTPEDRDERAEVLRVRRLVERTSALAVEPGVGALRFETPADLARVVTAGGEWRLEPGELRGRSPAADVEAHATARFAWHRIDSVTVCGGVVAHEDHGLRIVAGTVDVLLRTDGVNVVRFGEERIPVVPGLLRSRAAHTIVLRQCGGQVTVTVDGSVLRTGSGELAGTVSVGPANGSEIFVRSIDVVGEVDLAAVVRGASVR